MGSLISGATSVYTGIEEGNDSEKAARQQLDRQRQQANTAIDSAQEKGAYESGKQRMLTSQVVAKQKVAYTNSGIDATTGTAAAVQADTAALGEQDAQTMAINAAREAWGYKEAKKQAYENYQATSKAISRKQVGAVLGGSAQWLQGGMSMGGG